LVAVLVVTALVVTALVVVLGAALVVVVLAAVLVVTITGGGRASFSSIQLPFKHNTLEALFTKDFSFTTKELKLALLALVLLGIV
jgi:hypothetical protein